MDLPSVYPRTAHLRAYAPSVRAVAPLFELAGALRNQLDHNICSSGETELLDVLGVA
jgi:hypothetical protein